MSAFRRVCRCGLSVCVSLIGFVLQTQHGAHTHRIFISCVVK